VLKNHCQVRGHRVFIFPPRRAPGQSSCHRTAGRYGQADVFAALTTTLFAASRVSVAVWHQAAQTGRGRTQSPRLGLPCAAEQKICRMSSPQSQLLQARGLQTCPEIPGKIRDPLVEEAAPLEGGRRPPMAYRLPRRWIRPFLGEVRAQAVTTGGSVTVTAPAAWVRHGHCDPGGTSPAHKPECPQAGRFHSKPPGRYGDWPTPPPSPADGSLHANHTLSAACLYAGQVPWVNTARHATHLKCTRA
jgi:hypothetical protein